jgi:SRSO17 transposase
MNLEGTEDSASRFAAYVGQVTGVIGHADRVRPLNDYCAGLLSQRKGTDAVFSDAVPSTPARDPTLSRSLSLNYFWWSNPGGAARGE